MKTAPRHLKEYINELRPGDHLCLVYQDLAEQMEAVVPFLEDGLAAGECCVYVVDDRFASQILRALGRAGVDVDAQIERGALILWNKLHAYVHSGQLDPRRVIERLRKTYQEKILAGFKGLRIAGEMTWALGIETGWNRLLTLEEHLNRFFHGKRAIGLCQYNAYRFPVSVIQDVCRIHPEVLSNGYVSNGPPSGVRATERVTR